MIRRHRDHYLSTARRMDAEWNGPRQLEWAYWAHKELPNLRTALDRCLAVGNHRAALELSGALWVLWRYLGLVREGRYYLDRILSACPGPDSAKSRPLWVAAHLAFAQGDTVLGRSRAQECLENARRYGDVEAEAHAYLRIADSCLFTSDLRGARAYALKGAATFREAGSDSDSMGVLYVPQLLAMAATFDGDFDEAVKILEEVRLRCETRGELSQRSLCDYVLSLALFGRGEVVEAEQAAKASLEIKWQLRDVVGSVLAVDQLALIAAAADDGVRAAWLLGAAQRIWITFGLPGLGADAMIAPRQSAATRAMELVGVAAYAAAFGEGAASHIEATVAYALER
jgi:tetratricopeptide (TPR) repeat protein